MHVAHINQLKQAFSNIRIGIITTERNRGIFEKIEGVDEILYNSFYHYVKNRNKWQLYLDFQPTITTKSIIYDYILNPEIIINFGKKRKKLYNTDKVLNYDLIANVDENTHISQYLNCTALSPYLHQDDIYYSLNKSKSNYIEQLNLSTLKILLNPQGSMRELPPEELNVLLSGIDQKIAENITFLLTNTKDSIDYFEQIDKKFNVRLVEKMSIEEYFNLVNSVDLVIAVDGGGVHVACAYEKPLLAFYANCLPNLARWSPINRADTYIVIAKNQTDNNNATFDFPLEEAITWLNTQLFKLIRY